ncbi:DUF6265 family protein [uncultured Flavobacterium sp.]|uniref:DUF6265 family protein n=1 Tax=uncultured Flavobacterium sp. TaxID=165435 RepID=UPI0030CA4C6C
MKKIAQLFILVLTLTSCFKSNETSKIVVADWLLGKWENKTADGKLLEIWKKTNDSIYDGASYFIKGKDTLHFETIQLEQKADEVFYLSTIGGQNNDETVTFNLIASTENQFVFENPKNDYPQKIIYSLITNDSLEIYISGIVQGKPSSAKYSMTKMN